jgi:hypothetical protein
MLSPDIYDHPALFDALFPAGAQLPYYVELTRQASGDVLELAFLKSSGFCAVLLTQKVEGLAAPIRALH